MHRSLNLPRSPMPPRLPELPARRARVNQNVYKPEMVLKWYGAVPFTIEMQSWALKQPFFFALIGQHFYDAMRVKEEDLRPEYVEKVRVLSKVGSDGLLVRSALLDGSKQMTFVMGTNRLGQYVTGNGVDPVYVWPSREDKRKKLIKVDKS